MNEQDIKALLDILDLDEQMIVGNETTDVIIAKAIKGEEIVPHTPDGGSDFDFSTAFTIVSNAVSILMDVLKLKNNLSEKDKQRATASEILKDSPQKFTEEQINRLLDYAFPEN